RSDFWHGSDGLAELSQTQRRPLCGDPTLVILSDRVDGCIIEAAARLGGRESRVGADAAIREFAPVVGGVGEIAPRRNRRIEGGRLDRLWVGKLRDGDLARGGMAALGIAIELLCQIVHFLVLPPILQPAFYR